MSNQDDTLVEAVARALYECSGAYKRAWDDLPEDYGWRTSARLNARAAIAAARPIIEREALERAANVAEDRHERWRMPHSDNAAKGEVCCDVTACADIAAAIRALPVGQGL